MLDFFLSPAKDHYKENYIRYYVKPVLSVQIDGQGALEVPEISGPNFRLVNSYR